MAKISSASRGGAFGDLNGLSREKVLVRMMEDK